MLLILISLGALLVLLLFAMTFCLGARWGLGEYGRLLKGWEDTVAAWKQHNTEQCAANEEWRKSIDGIVAAITAKESTGVIPEAVGFQEMKPRRG